MFCPKCGTKNEDTAKFCAACGAPLRSGQPTAANASASVTQAGPRSQANLKNATTFIAGHRIKLIAITAVAVVAIAGVVLFNLLGKACRHRDLSFLVGVLACTSMAITSQ